MVRICIIVYIYNTVYVRTVQLAPKSYLPQQFLRKQFLLS